MDDISDIKLVERTPLVDQEESNEYSRWEGPSREAEIIELLKLKVQALEISMEVAKKELREVLDYKPYSNDIEVNSGKRDTPGANEKSLRQLLNLVVFILGFSFFCILIGVIIIGAMGFFMWFVRFLGVEDFFS
ncbi:uncharacterized protein RJT20DRAFT_1242 [Scheffersomyces xylosifermentans]|uniref:uncharacterized protein n=1 Tax=Scheffersomyces xylosifermentans TaxID=1304137 RepID=UPI00315CFF18